MLQPLYGDAVMAEHVDVVLRVLAELRLAGVLEHWFQRGQHAVAIELRRHTGIVVAQRYVAGVARFHREADADDLCAHRIDAGGFGVERDQFGVAKLFQPGVELRLGGDQFVVARCGKCRIWGARR